MLRRRRTAEFDATLLFTRAYSSQYCACNSELVGSSSPVYNRIYIPLGPPLAMCCGAEFYLDFGALAVAPGGPIGVRACCIVCVWILVVQAALIIDGLFLAVCVKETTCNMRQKTRR